MTSSKHCQQEQSRGTEPACWSTTVSSELMNITSFIQSSASTQHGLNTTPALTCPYCTWLTEIMGCGSPWARGTGYLELQPVPEGLDCSDPPFEPAHRSHNLYNFHVAETVCNCEHQGTKIRSRLQDNCKGRRCFAQQGGSGYGCVMRDTCSALEVFQVPLPEVLTSKPSPASLARSSGNAT